METRRNCFLRWRIRSLTRGSQSGSRLRTRREISITRAERLYNHLQSSTSNLEKELTSSKVKLDASCINEVITRCQPNQFQSGLRFFIWAGTQSGHRHSPYMYTKACDFLKIRANPDLIKDVVESYKKDECFVSVKTMRIVLSLCSQAKLAGSDAELIKLGKSFASKLKSKLKDTNRFDKAMLGRL